jgi:UDP-GlcNAc:undecaprenyl-phosphate/decaprenyl-phosphate GlcNAc-1-phosphate transferase
MDVSQLFIPFIVAFAGACVGLALVLVAKWRNLSCALGRADCDLRAVQSVHSRPTPRIGGIVVVIAAAVALSLSLPAEGAEPIIFLLVATLPVFLSGLLEDIGLSVKPGVRLAAAALSSGTMILLGGNWVTQTGVPTIDLLLSISPLAVAITLLWTTGLSHAFNLVDGMNGLLGGLALIIVVGMAFIAWRVEDSLLLLVLVVIAASLMAFLLFNFPHGAIFMGDAGAYAIGHILAWIGILLALRNDEVAGMAVALMFFWPVADTLLAIVRRKLAGARPDQPDRLHFHQLVMRGLEILLFGKRRRAIANPLTTSIVLPLAALPVITAAVFMESAIPAFGAMIGFSALFVVSYRLGFRVIRNRQLSWSGHFGRLRLRMTVAADQGP